MAACSTPQIQAAAGSGRHRVHGLILVLGCDILLSIWGGTHAHIGSISITQPRAARKRPNRISATSSVFNFSGHKDEAVARCCAEKIAAACNKTTVATAGIHIDDAAPGDIALLLKNVDRLCDILIKKLRAIQ